MPQQSRSQIALYAAAALAVLLLGARYLHGGDSRSPGRADRRPPAVRVERTAGGDALVHVVGAVRRPGVYRFPAGSRVEDAVRRAGGATRRADLGGLNLAAKVGDGLQVVVPKRGAAPTPAAAASASVAGTGAPGQPVSLNTATLEQLDTLDGVGPATARKILAYRQQHGGFRSVNELDQVPGIGPKKLAALRAQVRV